MKLKILSLLLFAFAFQLKAMEPARPNGLDENYIEETGRETVGPLSQLCQDLPEVGESKENHVEEAEKVELPTQAVTNSKSSSQNNQNTLKIADVVQFIKQHAGKKEAAHVSKVLRGKDKGEPKGRSKRKKLVKKRKKKNNKNPNEEVNGLRDFERIRNEEEAKSEERSIGVRNLAEMADTLSEFPAGDRLLGFVLNNIEKNTDAMRRKEQTLVEAQAQAATRLATREQELEQARAAAQEKGRADVEARVRTAGVTAQKWIDLIKDHPYVLVGIAGGVSAGFFAAKHGMKVLFNEIQRLIGIPKLAQDTSLLTFRERITKYLGFHKKEEPLKTGDLVFNPEFKRRINLLTASIRKTVENDGYFRNLLFYGLPGTGKTLTAKTIAKNSGLDYIYFASSDLAKLTVKDALNQVRELFECAKRSPKKLMIIIDEAELLFADRDNSETDSQMKKVLNLILTYTGTESKDYFVAALTNRPQDFDNATISRSDEKIEFPLPNYDDIKSMLALYVKKLLLVQPVIKPTFYEKLFGKKRQPKGISIEPTALNLQAIESIAKKLTGFVGRDISKLIIAIKAEAYATQGLRITKKLVTEVVDRKIQEKKNADQKFQIK